ncbi:juvenile hormone esterase-like [Calliopsis andreniformis]|uniref:juvenile hormone esterase-like n=1 Tax=Calliopsis andreniformis TaxID=337506 RepID=UPI003FCD23DE
MSNSVALLFTLLASSTLCIGIVPTPVIFTKSGTIRGEILETVWHSVPYSSFKGIPYAMPPLGNLRFKPPIPAQPWRGVLSVTKDPNTCPQVDINYGYIGDEDCLYLNVYTPETNFAPYMALKPVLVWIHGGAFVIGSSNSTQYGPDFFMEQDIVVVSVNYRLGAIGFLYMDHPEILGNAGLKDQVLALKWVQDNIAAFGGDPEQVTLAGQSAGSSSVLLHSLSEKSRNLYHRSIAQSGSPLAWLYHAPSDALESARELADYLDAFSTDPDELVRFFYNALAKDLVMGANEMDAMPAYVGLKFKPTKENAALAAPEDLFLTECPISLFATGNFKKHDMILGYTSNEFVSFTGPIFAAVNTTNPIWSNLNPFFSPMYNAMSTILKGIAGTFSDFSFKGPIDFQQRLLALYNKDHPIYYYMLSYTSQYLTHVVDEGVPIKSGTGHNDDVDMLFYVSTLNTPKDPENPYNKFKLKMVSLWANFVKYGDPTPVNANPINGVVWEPSGREGWLLNIDEAPAMMHRNEVIKESILHTERIMYRILPRISGCNSIFQPISYDTLFPSRSIF